MKRQEGMTLIELMVVVTVIGTLAAMAIPSLTNARIPANEVSAVSSLRSLTIVNEQYQNRFGSYAGGLADLAAGDYVDAVLGSGMKSGFVFSYAGSGATWTCNADPEAPGVSGKRYFFVDQTGVVRFSTTGTAGSSDQPVE